MITAFAPSKEKGQDPSNFSCGCFHSQHRLFGKAEGQEQGLLLVQPARTVSKHQPHGNSGSTGMAVPVPTIRVAGISWGRENKEKKGKIKSISEPQVDS